MLIHLRKTAYCLSNVNDIMNRLKDIGYDNFDVVIDYSNKDRIHSTLIEFDTDADELQFRLTHDIATFEDNIFKSYFTKAEHEKSK